jgi:hypothetical protein
MARKTSSTTTKKTSATKKTRRTAAGKAKSTVAESVSTPVVKQKKPIFRAGTWIAVLLLVASVELAIYFNREKEKKAIAEATPVRETTFIFNAQDGAVSSIEIKPADSNAKPVKVARDAKNAWAIVLPSEAEADQGLVEAAATQISALQIVSPISGYPEIFGLNKPAYVITIEFKGGKNHVLEVGDSTPTKSGYYVRVDKDKMMVTDLNGIDSLLQLAVSPPYLSTPTPTALPATPTPVPPTEAISTPTSAP